MCVAYRAPLILFGLITLTGLGAEYKLWSFSLFPVVHIADSLLPPFLVPNILLSVLLPNTPNLFSSLSARHQFHTRIIQNRCVVNGNLYVFIAEGNIKRVETQHKIFLQQLAI
jgi:hypothetical protein